MIGDVISVLIADSDLLALVPSTSINPVKRTQGVASPAVVVDYDNIRTNPTKEAASLIDFADVTITAYATTPLAAQTIADAVRAAMDAYETVINSEVYEFRFTTARTGYSVDNETIYTLEMEYYCCYSRVNDAAAGSAFYLTGYLAYLVGFSTTPSLVEAITGGAVWQYLHTDGVTRYRFVPSPYVESSDAFWESYDSGTDTLSGLIVSKA